MKKKKGKKSPVMPRGSVASASSPELENHSGQKKMPQLRELLYAIDPEWLTDFPKAASSDRAPLSSEQKQALDDLFSSQNKIEPLLNQTVTEARKSREKLILLAKLAAESTEALNLIALEHPDWAKSIARKMLYWPALVSNHTYKLRQVKLFLDNLCLGDGVDLPLDQKNRYSTDGTARKWAIKAIETISLHRGGEMKSGYQDIVDKFFIKRTSLSDGPDSSYILNERAPTRSRNDLLRDANSLSEMLKDPLARSVIARLQKYQRSFKSACVNLPDLSKRTVPLWMKAVRAWIRLITFDDSNKAVPELHRLGRHRADHEKRIINFPPGTKSYESNVRDGICEAISKVIKRIAPE